MSTTMTDQELATHQMFAMILAYVVNETAPPRGVDHAMHAKSIRMELGNAMSSMLWLMRHRTGSRWMIPESLRGVLDMVLALHPPSPETIRDLPADGLTPKTKVTMAHIESMREALIRHSVAFELAGLHEFVNDFVAHAEKEGVATSGEQWIEFVDLLAKAWKQRLEKERPSRG